MTNYKPLLYTLSILFIVTAISSFALEGFIDTSVINPDSFLLNNPFYEFVINLINASFFDCIPTTFSLFGFNICLPVINIIALLGSGIQNFIVTQIIILSYIPDIILIPSMIVGTIAIIWSSVKLFLP